MSAIPVARWSSPTNQSCLACLHWVRLCKRRETDDAQITALTQPSAQTRPYQTTGDVLHTRVSGPFQLRLVNQPLPALATPKVPSSTLRNNLPLTTGAGDTSGGHVGSGVERKSVDASPSCSGLRPRARALSRRAQKGSVASTTSLTGLNLVYGSSGRDYQLVSN